MRLHAGQGDHDAAADRHAAAGQAGAGAARQERHVELVARFHDRDDLLGGGRKDDDVGPVLLDGEAVALVDGEVGRGGEHVVAADDGGQAGEEHHSVARRRGG